MFRRLLTAFDGSEQADWALREAIDLAQAVRGVLTVMVVIPDPSSLAFAGGYGGVTVDVAHGVEERMLATLEAAIAMVPDDLPVTKIVGRGAAGPAIVREAAGGAHDLLLMGSRGRGELSCLILGSVSHHVLQRSTIPVLITRQRTDDAQLLSSVPAAHVGRWA